MKCVPGWKVDSFLPADLKAQAAYSTFLCLAKEKLQKKRHKGGEDFDFFPSLDLP